MTFPQGGTEFGGHPGPYQPMPHDPEDSSYESLNLMVQTGADGDVSEVLAEHIERGKRRL